MKILVIEDETAIADFLRRGLIAEGYTVDAVGHDARSDSELPGYRPPAAPLGAVARPG